MNILQQTFTTGQVLRATELTNTRLQSWLRGDRIVGHRGEKAPPADQSRPGANRQFSFFNVMEIAVAKELSDLGMSTADAFNAASSFAHAGDEHRFPSLPFGEDGYTIICARGPESTEALFRPGEDITSNLRYRLGNGFTMLFIDELFGRVCQGLGYDYRDVLSEAYQDSSQ